MEPDDPFLYCAQKSIDNLIIIGDLAAYAAFT
jgi:hypothetical protein